MSQVIMASSEREFAIVVFGASGFTGQFVVREVARNCKGKFKWAIAGRSKDKLEKVLQETASELGRYTAFNLHNIPTGCCFFRWGNIINEGYCCLIDS